MSETVTPSLELQLDADVPTPIACWGDSLTAGDLGGATSYPEQLEDLYGDGRTVYNGGVDGESSTQIATRMLAATDKHDAVTVIWAGRNNFPDPTTIKADIAAMVAALTTPRFIVVSIINGTNEWLDNPNYLVIAALNADLAALYPDNFYDLRAFMVAQYNPAIPQDVIDHDNDIPPSSLRIDTLHFNTAGYALVAGAIKARLALLPGAWVDVAGDLIRDPVRWNRGISGAGPTDRLARPGLLSFTLDNTNQNAAGLADYYTPGHANCLDGFRHGIRVRLKLTDGTNTRYVWAGRLQSILPDAAVVGMRGTSVVAIDKFAQLAEMDASGLSLMESVAADALIGAVLDAMSDPPAQRDIDVGVDEYAFAFDDLGGSTPRGMAVAQDIVQSELGALYGRGDDTDGETWRFENRYARTVKDVDLTITRADLVDSDDAVDVPSTLDQLYNDVDVQTVPRRVDSAATTVLVKQDAAIEVLPGQTVRIFVDYRDPSNEAEFVGGKNVSMAPTSDWTANTAVDGAGSDLTADFAIVATCYGSRAMLEVTNNGSVTGFVRGPSGDAGLQAIGKGLYRYAPVTSRGTNATSIAAFQSRQLPQPIVMPYQSDREIGQGVADYIAHIYGGLSAPRRILYASELDAAHLAQGILRDVGDRLALDEDVAGVPGLEMFIQSIDQELDINGRLSTAWGLAPADTTRVFIFDHPLSGLFDVSPFGYL